MAQTEIGAEIAKVLGGVSDAGTGNWLTDAISESTAQLAQLRSALQAQSDNTAANTRAVADNTARVQDGGSKAAVVSRAGSALFGGGILGPILTGLTGLFGERDGGASEAPPVRFALPPALNVEAGIEGGSAAAVDYSETGVPRRMPVAPQTGAAQVTIQVTAMDSRSFLDHSAEIASAVRRAMLESNALNDVMGEF